jgi:hypothetical protein
MREVGIGPASKTVPVSTLFATFKSLFVRLLNFLHGQKKRHVFRGVCFPHVALATSANEFLQYEICCIIRKITHERSLKGMAKKIHINLQRRGNAGSGSPAPAEYS